MEPLVRVRSVMARERDAISGEVSCEHFQENNPYLLEQS